MSERSGYKPGEFCWVDLATTDVDAAVAYYSDLLGAEFVSAGPDGGGYGFLNQGGKMVAGLGPIQMPGQPAAWSGYIVVTDADDTVAKPAAAGGNVIMPPMDLPMESGRIAVMQDAEGAYLSIIELNRHNGAELVNEVGSWTWNRLGSRDFDKATAFYNAVFDWTATQTPDAPPDLPYWMWQVEGQKWEEGLAGLNLMAPEIPAEVPPHWSVFFAVPDAQEAMDKTVAAGGQVLMGPLEVPVGIMAVMFDPQGAEVAILQPNYPEAR